MLRLREPEGEHDIRNVNKCANDHRGRSYLYCIRFTRHRQCKLARHERERSADHASANIGGKALASTAQMKGIHARQVVAPKTKLRDRKKSHNEDANLQGGQAVMRCPAKDNWQHN